MDIYRIKEDITFAEQIGVTLETGQRMKLQLGLLRLTELANSDQLLFWGKIQTTTRPYYIAVALDYKGKYEFPHKRFFYSLNDFKFTELPEILVQYSEKVGSFNYLPLTGNPKNILVNIAGEGQPKQQIKKSVLPEVDSDEQQITKVEAKNFTEVDRLAYVVRAIQNDCQLVPVGAFRLTEQHELRINDHFTGILLSKSLNLSSYQLFRSPQTKLKREKIQKPDTIFTFDFLDSIEGEKHWSIQTDSSHRNITIRNLYWPGYLGYHKVQTNIFGGVYFGDGCKRVDLPFYL